MVEIEIVRDRVTLARLQALAESSFGDLVKSVVDIDRAVMAIGGELQADEEALLIDDGSRQSDLWGINLYPAAWSSSRMSAERWLEPIGPRPPDTTLASSTHSTVALSSSTSPWPTSAGMADDARLPAREVVCEFLVGDNAYGSTAEDLDAYFLAFAMAARSERT